MAKVDGFVVELVRDMHRLAKEYDGIGLAAPQVGESLRVFVTCALYGEPERAFINPRIELSGAIVGDDEGCLSLPEIRAEIMRPPVAKITALDLEGNEFTLEREGIWARVWQHEYDHLEGVLLVDRMSPADKARNKAALAELVDTYRRSQSAGAR